MHIFEKIILRPPGPQVKALSSMSAQANAFGANAPVLTNVPAYADFASDPRCTMNEQSGKWNYVGDDGISYEYDETMGAWFPMVRHSSSI